MSGPSVAYWLTLFLWLGTGVMLVAGASLLIAGWQPTSARRRLVWQAALLSVLLLVAFEISGASSGATRFLQARHGADHRASAESRSSAFESSSDLAIGDDAGTDPMTGWVAASGAPLDRGAAAGWKRVATWWPGIVWAIGSIWMLLRLGIVRLRLARLVARGGAARDGVRDAALAQTMRSLAARLGVRGLPRIVRRQAGSSPIVFGIARPTLALPVDFESRFSGAQQEAILAHELAHVAVRDPLWHLVSDLVVALMWWHPLAHAARRHQQAASEAAADEACLVVDGGPDHLAECLVILGAGLARRDLIGLSAADGGFRSGLGRRVERLLALDGGGWRRPSGWRGAVIRSLVPLGTVAVLVLGTGWARPAATLVADEASLDGDGDMKLASLLRGSLLGCSFAALLGASGEPPTVDPAAPDPAVTDPAVERATVETERIVRDASDSTVRRVPIIADIPLIGTLFESRTFDAATDAADPLTGKPPKAKRKDGSQANPLAKGRADSPGPSVGVVDELVVTPHGVARVAIDGKTRADSGDNPLVADGFVADSDPGAKPGAVMDALMDALQPADATGSAGKDTRIVVEARIAALVDIGGKGLQLRGGVKMMQNEGDEGAVIVVMDPDADTLAQARKASGNEAGGKIVLIPLEPMQRGQICHLNQTAYVSRYDVERHGEAFIADPVIDVIQEGVFLDIVPTIDRGKVHLDVSLDVSDLTALRVEKRTVIDGAVPVEIQVPEVSRWKSTFVYECGKNENSTLLIIVPGARANFDVGDALLIELSARRISAGDAVYIDASSRRASRPK